MALTTFLVSKRLPNAPVSTLDMSLGTVQAAAAHLVNKSFQSLHFFVVVNCSFRFQGYHCRLERRRAWLHVCGVPVNYTAREEQTCKRISLSYPTRFFSKLYFSFSSE